MARLGLECLLIHLKSETKNTALCSHIRSILINSVDQFISSSRCKTARASLYGLKGQATEIQYSLLMRICKLLQDLGQLTNVRLLGGHIHVTTMPPFLDSNTLSQKRSKSHRLAKKSPAPLNCRVYCTDSCTVNNNTNWARYK